MMPEIEQLKNLAAGTINKGRLVAIRAAHLKAYNAFCHLESKPGDADMTLVFEDAQAEIEDALSELEFACDELETAEEKEEREDAIDQVKGSLEEAISSFESIMEVAVIGAVNHVAKQNEQEEEEAKENEAKVKEILSLPLAERFGAVKEWLDSASTPELRDRRWKAVESVVSKKKD